jgi:hypothetical protein
MARAIIAAQRPAYEPLYDIDPHTGLTIEVFHVDKVLAASFDRRSGWFWWKCWPGCLPDGEPYGPFPSSYRAYRNAIDVRRATNSANQFGERSCAGDRGCSATFRVRRAVDST